MVEVSLILSIISFIVFIFLLFKLAQSLFKIAALVILLIISGSFLFFFAFSDDLSMFVDTVSNDDIIFLVQEQDSFVAGFSSSSPEERLTADVLLAYNEALPENQTFFIVKQELFAELANDTTALTDAFSPPQFFELIGSGDIVIQPDPGFIIKNAHYLPSFVFELLTSEEVEVSVDNSTLEQ